MNKHYKIILKWEISDTLKRVFWYRNPCKHAKLSHSDSIH